MELFDTVCHLDFPVFDADRKELIEQAESVGVKNILLPATTKEKWRVQRMHVALNKNLHVALGMHPMFIDEHTEQHLHDLDMALNLPPVTAVGEIGLDFYDRSVDMAKQEIFFRAQLKLAKTKNLPVILHVRKAHDEIIKHLVSINFREAGIVHAFNGSLDHAKKYMEKGFKLGFGGTLTYERSVKIRELAKMLPLESIVLETDAPDMIPSGCDLKRNTPAQLVDVFNVLCKLRDESADEIAATTTANAKQILHLD